MSKEKKQSGCCGNFLWILIICGLIGSCGDNSEKEKTPEDYASYEEYAESQKIVSEENKKEELNFVESISKYIDSSVAENIENIYIEQIGFSEIKFDSKMDGLENYYIYANGYETVATIMDDYCRIFIPSSDYVFYEDGNVILAAEDFLSKQIDSNERSKYYFIAQEIIKQCLVSPSSSDFPFFDTEVSMEKQDNLVAVKGYVDSKNAMGIDIRSNYVVQFYVTDLENMFYEIQYVNIEGETTGSFIEFD